MLTRKAQAGVLSVEAVNVHIEASHILHDVTVRVGEQELVCLVGRNGAGKTTLLRTIMGYLRSSSGTIAFRDRSIAGLPTHRIAALGIGYSPEESGIFGDLSVAENIEIATWTRASERSPQARVALAYDIFPTLRGYAARGGTQLSGGERKMLSIARALALDPTLLLLDEPFEGLSPAIIPVISRSIAEIAKLGRSVLLAESNIHHVPEYASRLYVIERGEIIFAGAPRDVERQPDVLRVIGGTS